MARAFPRALALAALLAAPLALAGPFSDKDVVSMVQIGELPPPPPHSWADPQADLLDNRINGNGLVSLPAVERYLNGLYAMLKASAGVPDWPGAVYISADTTLNAHAAASGNVYLNIGTILSAETEDELVAVLAHEFAHVYLNHQAAYEAHVTASNVNFFGRALAFFSGKLPLNATAGWSVADSLGLVSGASHDALIPAWQRSVEEQADMFGASLLLRNKYSYVAGFKTFLERLATIEQRDRAARPPSPEPAAKDNGAPRQTHATAAEREARLTELVAPLIPRPRPAPRKAPWQAVLKDKQTAEVLAHYRLLPQIEQLQAARRPVDALKLAQTAASGATAGDATMVLVLAEALRQAGRSREEQRAVLARNHDWPERAWSVSYQSALQLGEADKLAAKRYLEEEFKAFGEAPRAMPDMVGFYLAAGASLERLAVETRCLTDGRFRDSCIQRGQTEEERARQRAMQEQREQQLLNSAQQKIDKLFKR